jgi:hypothetical protein
MEYLYIELYDSYFSMGWSSPVRPANMVSCVQSLGFSMDGASAVLFENARDTHTRATAHHAVARIQEFDGAFSFVRLELSGLTIIWDTPVPADPAAPPYEVATIAPMLDPDLCAALLQATASPNVERHWPFFRNALEYVGDALGVGSLLKS